MVDESFFLESLEQSKIKTRIVTKYFWAWAKVIIPTAKRQGNRIAYLDLFCGPGRYKDGTISTPIMVLAKAIDDPDMKEMLMSVFNDKDQENTQSLSKAIAAIPGIERLKYKPQIRNGEVGSDIVKAFENIRFVPTLFFVDPWGYKGLSLALINSVLKDWGCDCIFFFNYNRINMGMTNTSVNDHMNVLFGKERADRIREKLNGLSSEDRESLIIEELSQALKEMGATYILPFCFKNEHATRTTHHLIFATKNFKGYEIMKEIMAHESSEQEQGVPSFEYSPASIRYPLLFALSRPLDDLEESLLRGFAGQRLRMNDIYTKHSVGKPYVKSNYKKALTNLEAAGKVMASPPSAARPIRQGRPTFGDTVFVEFPRRLA